MLSTEIIGKTSSKTF